MGLEQREIIAIGSQASICMIARYMDSRLTIQQCKQKVKLEDIAAQLQARVKAGLYTDCIMANSHNGILGNKEDDV